MKIKHLRLLTTTMVWLLGFMPMLSHALSIGNMEIKSTYGQPLDARITIPAYTEKEIESLSVGLASQQAYDEAGLQWFRWFSHISMTLRYDDKGKPYIAIRSVEPINELTLSLIIEFNWKGGRTARQFDAFLSPTLPSLTAEPVAESHVKTSEHQAELATATEQELSQSLIAVPAADSKANPTPKRPRSQLKELGNGRYSYGPIMPGQTLSSVAEKFASKTELSLQQRMQILFDLNPEAFSANSFGSLKAGYTLQFSNDVTPGLPPQQSPSQTQPDYESNVDSVQQFGQVVRLQKADEAPNEAQTILKKLRQTRQNVEEYRKINNDLRARMVELEEQLKVQADQLGIIEPDALPDEQSSTHTTLVQ